MESYYALRSFRRSFYECLHRRKEALFELGDAILTAEAVSSPVHLSLQESHRRGWGSFYTALDRGRIDVEALRDLLAGHPLAGGGSPRLRRGRERVAPMRRGVQSPARLLLPSFPPLRRAAHRRLLWAYQFVAELGFARESWTAPVDVLRVHPDRETNMVAIEQVKAFLGRSPTEGAVPLCSSSTPSLRPRKAAAGAGGECVPDPRPFASGAALLRRPEPLGSARTLRTPSSLASLAEDEVP
jgi:hypothetical protein